MYHLADYTINPKQRKLRFFKDSKCGVRGTGMGISGVKCGNVVKGRKFSEELKRDRSHCCQHCVTQFEKLAQQIKGATA